MKSALKIFLLVIVCLIAVKLLPVTLALGAGLAAMIAVVVALGASAVAVLLVAALVVTALLSPLWFPVLLLVGIIALIRRCSRTSA